MKRVRFSEHALFQMRERELGRGLILNTLAHPDKRYRQSSGRLVTVKHIFKNKKTYCVVVVSEETPIASKIITVFVTSKIRKYLL
ncbi:MAG: hypothetical protein G01um101417_654 [Parcubacteria group bacterium Gr01-1014_17]|nr:MAG: hypothetical protein G01um101417_654 [Parcubacteria group bacterium Gr01-1014_17]